MRRPPFRKKKQRKHNRQRTCNGKVRFRDEKEALIALHLIGNDDHRDKTPTRAYRCPRCKGVHLSSMPYPPPPLSPPPLP